MKVINDGLPIGIYNAIARAPYGGAGEDRYESVTGLLKPAWLRELTKRHFHEIEVPASQRLKSFVGTAVHTAIELANNNEKGMVQEQRLAVEIDGKKITGGVDLYHDAETSFDESRKRIIDYKTTGTWAYASEHKHHEWKMQLNVYAYMYRQHGHEVHELAIQAMFLDWSESRATYKNYPPKPVVEIDIPLMEDDEIVEWIRSRFAAHVDAASGVITDCSPEERWERPDEYRVLKPGQERAVRVFKSAAAEIEAAVFMEGKPNLIIDVIPGERGRCKNCEVNRWCPSWQEYSAKNKNRKTGKTADDE